MSNRIESVELVQRRVSPLEAELWVVVTAAHVNAGTELRGRLTGPVCPGVQTVQVAYPLRPIPRPPGHPENALVGRVVVPEPNLWSPETPFTYQVFVELWQDGAKCGQSQLGTGFRSR